MTYFSARPGGRCARRQHESPPRYVVGVRALLGLFIHNPVWVVIGVVQPLLYLILFAPLLKSIANAPGFPSGGAYNVFVPGLLVQLGMFGAAGVGFSLIAELRMGVIERLRVTPVSRVALLLGRALRDIVSIVIQSLILILLALPFGLSIHPIGVVIVLALIGLIGLLTASIAYAVALWVRSEDSYAPLIFTSSLPILLLSGVLLPLGPGSPMAAHHRGSEPALLCRRCRARGVQRPPG